MHGTSVGWYFTLSEISQDINRAHFYIHASKSMLISPVCSQYLTTIHGLIL